MSLGLLSADYASSSSSESSSSEEERHPETETKALPAKLDNPFAPAISSKEEVVSSVFSNPFLESERAKESLLEKHVSLTKKQEDRSSIDGKKVCWNFRKGRCRFGHTCSFAHDSDVQIRKDKTTSPLPEMPIINKSSKKREAGSSKGSRPGLSDSLLPSKKSKKHYDKLYN